MGSVGDSNPCRPWLLNCIILQIHQVCKQEKYFRVQASRVMMAHFFHPLFPLVPSFAGQTSHPNHCECSCHRSPFQFISAALVIALMGHSALPALVVLACWTFVAGQITPAPLRHHCHSRCSSLQSVGSVVTISTCSHTSQQGVGWPPPSRARRRHLLR
jgi:hypothetical protein